MWLCVCDRPFQPKCYSCTDRGDDAHTCMRDMATTFPWQTYVAERTTLRLCAAAVVVVVVPCVMNRAHDIELQFNTTIKEAHENNIDTCYIWMDRYPEIDIARKIQASSFHLNFSARFSLCVSDKKDEDLQFVCGFFSGDDSTWYVACEINTNSTPLNDLQSSIRNACIHTLDVRYQPKCQID